MSKVQNLHIKPERARNILGGHPWIFSGALENAEDIPNGSLVRVRAGKQVMGIGYYNAATDIAVRMLSPRDETIDTAFFIRRFSILKEAKEKYLPPKTNAYRAVFAESDSCPGLVVDRYADVLVAQFHTLGMDNLKRPITEALAETHHPSSIIERSDVSVRKHEGLDSQPVGLLYGKDVSEVEIEEYGFKFLVHVLQGQKTGFFLDQRENRHALLRYCPGQRVLNCFSYTGGFSVYAASAARKVVSVDISKPATEYCRRNFILNNLKPDNHGFEAMDVFDYLKSMPMGAFDLIILDPPSFAKNKRQLPNAIKAYTTINSKALEKLPDGGILVSSSCTSHVDPLTFIKIIHQSAVNTRCTLQVLESREQPFDHAYNLAFPEGRYLKFMILRKSIP